MLLFLVNLQICILDSNDYYFVDMKNSVVKKKSDIIKNKSTEWCLLVDFIEFHIKNKLAIPCDINLKNQEEIIRKVYDKIMELDGTEEENVQKFDDIWSNGNCVKQDIKGKNRKPFRSRK